MSRDWYRRKSWTTSDQKEFFAKLKRARKENRAQYLKIQAIEFQETGEKELLDAAEELINQLLSEFPDNGLNKSTSLYTLGNIYKKRNDLNTALSYYLQAIEFEMEYPNVVTPAYLEFSDLALKLERSQHYDLIEELIKERLKNSLFPIEKYRGYSTLAIISKEKGENDNFKRFKKLAEENATQKQSGLRYHQDLGIVKKRDSWLEKLLRKNRNPE